MMPILVVDDEQEIRDSLKMLLTSAGYEVDTASNGLEALEYVREHPRDVGMMLVDLSMPGMTGDELIGSLRRERKLPPAIVITGLPPQLAERACKHGVGYMRKPVDSVLLLSSIEAAIGRESGSGN